MTDVTPMGVDHIVQGGEQRGLAEVTKLEPTISLSRWQTEMRNDLDEIERLVRNLKRKIG